jgi:hypothetical protein
VPEIIFDFADIRRRMRGDTVGWCSLWATPPKEAEAPLPEPEPEAGLVDLDEALEPVVAPAPKTVVVVPTAVGCPLPYDGTDAHLRPLMEVWLFSDLDGEDKPVAYFTQDKAYSDLGGMVRLTIPFGGYVGYVSQYMMRLNLPGINPQGFHMMGERIWGSHWTGDMKHDFDFKLGKREAELLRLYRP